MVVLSYVTNISLPSSRVAGEISFDKVHGRDFMYIQSPDFCLCDVRSQRFAIFMGCGLERFTGHGKVILAPRDRESNVDTEQIGTLSRHIFGRYWVRISEETSDNFAENCLGDTRHLQANYTTTTQLAHHCVFPNCFTFEKWRLLGCYAVWVL
jgi:hypothetical protein